MRHVVDLAIGVIIGVFLNTVTNFVIVAAAVFLIVSGLSKLRRKHEAKPAAPPREEVLLTEIRDLLKAWS